MKKVIALCLLVSIQSIAGTCTLTRGYRSRLNKVNTDFYPTIMESRHKEFEVSRWEECYDLAADMAKDLVYLKDMTAIINPTGKMNHKVYRIIGINFIEWHYGQPWKLNKMGQVNRFTYKYDSPHSGWRVFDEEGYLNRSDKF